MTIKYAIEAACPEARIWLDQDERTKSEAGMMHGAGGGATHGWEDRRGARFPGGTISDDTFPPGVFVYRSGVEHSRFFVLFLSQCVFARGYCKKEIRHALKHDRRIVLVRETDTRHGAPQVRWRQSATLLSLARRIDPRQPARTRLRMPRCNW